MRTPVAAVAIVVAAAAAATARQTPATAPGTIWIAASAIHQDGHLVSDLTAADFVVTDNGDPRDISTFRNDRIPIAVALMIDVSSSMESNFGLVRTAVSSLAQHFEPGDRAIIGTFDALSWIGPRFSARPETLQKSLAAALGGTLTLCDGDWIDKAALAKRNESANTNFGTVNEFSRRLAVHGGSAIWDGAACGVNAVAADGETPRRIVVLLTDGEDTMSFSTVGSVIARARQYGVIIYAVALMGGYGMAGAELKSLAEATGGGYFYLASAAGVGEAFARIGDELRHQYVFGFVPSGSPSSPHAIDVKTRAADTTIRFRRVFLENAPSPAPPPARSAGRPAPGPTLALPAGMTVDERGARAKDEPAAMSPATSRTPLWDTLDAFATTAWSSGTAPRMSIDGLRATLATLRREASAWIRSTSPSDQPRRRLAASAYVLDLLYSQNDPFIWTNGQPAPDLLQWAATTLQTDPPRPEERLWYFAALSLVERGGVPDLLEQFALRALGRFPGEGRFALARGVAQDLRTWPEERDVRTFTVAPAVASLLIARYEAASLIPSVTNEAILRLGYFELRRGRVDAALARFDALGDQRGDDVVLRFWGHLLRGRALEQANRLPEAIASFQQALEDVPAATSARSALIAALARSGRPAAAGRIAAGALEVPASVVDPWTFYVLPDMRFWEPVAAALRRAVTR